MGVVNICMMRRIGRGGYELSNLFFLWVGGFGLLCFGFGLGLCVTIRRKDETTMDDEIRNTR